MEKGWMERLYKNFIDALIRLSIYENQPPTRFSQKPSRLTNICTKLPFANGYNGFVDIRAKQLNFLVPVQGTLSKMGDGVSPTEASFDVYKYRRSVDRNESQINRPPNLRFSTLDNSSNIYFEVDEQNRHKTYAILHEHRQEFTNTYLRSILIFYSNSAWKIFILFMLFIAYILDSCIYTFFKTNERPLWVILIITGISFAFTFDVAVLLGLKISKRWRKTLNLVEPDTFRVAVNVTLAIPFSFFYFLDDTLINCHAISPIISTLRVYRIVEYFYIRSSQAGCNQWTSFLSQYLILFILGVHTWTCVWYLLSYRGFQIQLVRSSWSLSAILLPTETTMDWYFVCCYWSVMCLTTNALGDIYPANTTERILASLSVLVGFLLTTVVFVGSLTSQFITITTRRSKYVRRLKKIQNHLMLINMDKDITKRIIRYYEDLWYQKSGVFKPKLLNLLPYPLQMEICYDLNAVPLYASLLFRKLPEAFLRRLSLDMSHQFYLPGDIVTNENQNKNVMFCITNGVLELLSDEDNESPMISLAKGTCFSEISLIYNIPSKVTIKAATYVECQVLEKTKFIRLMVTYPDLFDQIRTEIDQRIDRCKRRKQIQGSQTEFTLNVYASKDRKKSSIKCLKDKLRYIQGLTETDNLTEDDILDENCLNLYIISEHIKTKTTTFTCVNSYFPWILEHDCHLVKYWERYMLLIVLYICLVYPYFIGIKREFASGTLFYAGLIIRISLLLNVFMTSVTAVKTKKKYITDFKGILSYNLNTVGFYLDLISIIPFEHIVTIHTTVRYYDEYRAHLFLMCKGVKLCLVWRLSSFFEKLERKLLLNSLLIKTVKYWIYICLLSYWCGVVLFMESCFVSRCSDNSWFSKALLSDGEKPTDTLTKTEYPLVAGIYFALSVLLSVGYGDFTPGDRYDMGFVAFLSVFGVLLSGYFISEFSAVVTHWLRTKTTFLEVIMTIDKFMKDNNMHPAIKRRIMAFYELQWQYNSGVEVTDENWLQKTIVPLELRKKVLHQARFRALTSIKFFQVKNKSYIHTLTETAKEMILPPGEIVYYGGTVTRELYIIESGYCLLTSQEMRIANKERVIGPGNHLGLLVLLYGVPAVSTVITLTHCKLISVSHAAYTSALSLYPDMKEHEGLMKPEELEYIENLAKNQNSDGYLKHYNNILEKKRIKIAGILQEFLNNSFINLSAEYKRKNESYFKSFKQFNILENISPYFLLPIAIKPDGIFLTVWAFSRVMVAYINCMIIPIVVSMAPLYHVFNVPVVAVEIFCYIDMYLMLHVAFYGKKNQLIYHPYLTAKNYLKGNFLMDFITCFPWYAMLKLLVPSHNEHHTREDHLINNHMLHCSLRMINVLQIYKLYAVFAADSLKALKRAYLMSVLHFFLLTLFFLNLYTSILIILTCRYVKSPDEIAFGIRLKDLSLDGPYMETVFHPSGNMVCQKGSWIDIAKILKSSEYLSPGTVYLLAYYWAVSSFSGAGFGDVTPQDTKHMILSICVNVHGVFFFGYVYARIASLKAMSDKVVTKFQENVKHLDMFLNREHVPISLKKTVMEYWKYQWKRTGGWSHQSILGKLHANLNEDAVLYMYEKTLREIPLFENVEFSFFRAFAKKLKELYFQKGYMVIRSNEVIETMYIIFRGKVDILSDINEVEACMGPGGIFGNIRGAKKYLTMSTIIASRNIDVLSIAGRDFYSLLKSYPAVLRKVNRSVESTSKDYVIPTISSDRESTELQSSPLTYEPDDGEDDFDVTVYLESPEKSIAESHGSKSITSTGNADFVSALFLIFLPHRWFRSSIIPDSKLVTFMDCSYNLPLKSGSPLQHGVIISSGRWYHIIAFSPKIQYLILCIGYTDFMLLTYQMAFHTVPFFLSMCVTSDAIFLFKMFLDIHCGYMNRYGDYILNPKMVRNMYFSKVSHRRRDFLANFIICYIAFALPASRNLKLALFTYMRTPILARITYLFTYSTHRKTNIGSSNLFLKLLSIGIWASILTHVNACLFFKLSCLTPEHCSASNWMTKSDLNLRVEYSERKFFSIYISALWYMINLLTITGTGDVSSQNSFEVIETIIIILIIKFCTGLLISEMSAMMTAHSSSLISYDYGINELRDGLNDTDLSDHQMNKMWEYVRELWNRQQGRQMPELVHQLPFRLRCQVMQAIYGSHIRESVIFSKAGDDFRRMLAMWMKHCVFFPGNYIVQCGDSDQCIYFIHRGQVEVLTVHVNLTESIYDVLGPEDSFGVAQGLFVGVSHHFSFRAQTVVDVVYLKLEKWKYLLDFYPKSAKVIQRKVENVYLAI